jgi:hypothetical protein
MCQPHVFNFVYILIRMINFFFPLLVSLRELQRPFRGREISHGSGRGKRKIPPNAKRSAQFLYKLIDLASKNEWDKFGLCCLHLLLIVYIFSGRGREIEVINKYLRKYRNKRSIYILEPTRTYQIRYIHTKTRTESNIKQKFTLSITVTEHGIDRRLVIIFIYNIQPFSPSYMT